MLREVVKDLIALVSIVIIVVAVAFLINPGRPQGRPDRPVTFHRIQR